MPAQSSSPDPPAHGAPSSPCKTCPSSSCRDGALLLGIMTGSGKLAYVDPPVRIDAAFVAQAREQGSPERRFRFAGPCVEDGCPQWTGEGCGVADLVVDRLATDASTTDSPDAETPAPDTRRTLPACSIRRSCRWFSQRGAAACTACPLIVADLGGTDTYHSTHPQADPEHVSAEASRPLDERQVPPRRERKGT